MKPVLTGALPVLDPADQNVDPADGMQGVRSSSLLGSIVENPVNDRVF